jgi:3-mercaptopyruvate sulfurtransferase SseA
MHFSGQGKVGHWRLPVFAALAASHHHTVGNAGALYSGSLSGWENRSQRAVRTLL